MGVNNIAKTFLGKHMNDLDAAEIALIMAAARGGFATHGDYGFEQLQTRRNQILERMFINGAISEGQFRDSSNQTISRMQHKMMECPKMR